jgi:hypothetical protein
VPQSALQLLYCVPVPQDSLIWHTPSPQVKMSTGRRRVVTGMYETPF